MWGNGWGNPHLLPAAAPHLWIILTALPPSSISKVMLSPRIAGSSPQLAAVPVTPSAKRPLSCDSTRAAQAMYCPPPCTALLVVRAGPGGAGRKATLALLPLKESHCVCGWGGEGWNSAALYFSTEQRPEQVLSGGHHEAQGRYLLPPTATRLGGGEPSPSRKPCLTPSLGIPGQHQPSHGAQCRGSLFPPCTRAPRLLQPSGSQLQPRALLEP